MGDEQESVLYHGTCKAFVEYAKLNNGQFGPADDSVSFTPDLRHALDFAEGWDKVGGRARLREMFEDELDPDLRSPVVLSFARGSLGDLEYRDDCGAREFYLENGPVNLDQAQEIAEV
tara:strand:- start:270 stop:623 length:354 start_codon:yes stop_codon:yes gene_type:complete